MVEINWEALSLKVVSSITSFGIFVTTGILTGICSGTVSGGPPTLMTGTTLVKILVKPERKTPLKFSRFPEKEPEGDF